MKIIIDINHPAHVHFFKNFIWEIQQKRHRVLVTASNKDIVFDLLKNYKIDFINMGSYGKGMISKIIKFPIMNIRMLRVLLKEKPDYVFSIACTRPIACKLTKTNLFVFTDTEHATEQIALFKPFATKIYTPDCFTKDLGPKQVRYPGYHELAYLHPNRFKPNPEVLEEISLKEGDPFFIVRFVSWDASHDIGQKGLSIQAKRKLINILKDKGKIIITSEGPLPEEFEPYRMNICPTKMHDLLYYATMYIGEGGTMASEAACLGTYSIYINSLPAMGYIKEEIEKYDLIFKSTDWENIAAKLMKLLSNPYLKSQSKAKRKIMLEDKIDLNQWMIDFFEKEIEKQNSNN